MTLTIRENGYYRRRDGNVVGPTVKHFDGQHPWILNVSSYAPSGRWRKNETDSKYDLISEVHVTDVLGFELKAGGKYETSTGEVVTLRSAGFTALMAYFIPFSFAGAGGGYCNKHGELSSGARIVRPYVPPPPPTPIERLEAWEKATAYQGRQRDELLSIIADLKKQPLPTGSASREQAE